MRYWNLLILSVALSITSGMFSSLNAAEVSKVDLKKDVIRDKSLITKSKSVDIDIDFESIVQEYSVDIAKPWKYKELLISANGGSGSYYLFVMDATRKMTVFGPRSMGIETGNFDRFINLSFKNPQQVLWLSFIKISSGYVQYSIKDEKGNKIKTGSFSFNESDPIGTYRTFFVPLATPNKAKIIEFSGNPGFLTRVMARNYTAY